MEFPVRPIHRLEVFLSNDICHMTPPVILITNEPLSNERVVNFNRWFELHLPLTIIGVQFISFQFIFKQFREASKLTPLWLNCVLK